LHSTGRFITDGLRQHFGPIRKVNMFKKKRELNHWRWDPYAATKHLWQTNLHYATIQDLLYVSNYNTQKGMAYSKQKTLKIKLELMSDGCGGDNFH